MKLLIGVLVIAFTVPISAQSVVETGAIGEYRRAAGDTAEQATAVATADATRKVMQAAVRLLQDRADITALNLPPGRLDAYVDALVEVGVASASAGAANAGVVRVELGARVDADDAARRVAGLRKDQDVAMTLVEIHAEREALYARLNELSTQIARAGAADTASLAQQRQTMLSTLAATAFAARATAALARTEENPAGGRVAPAVERARAKPLAEQALAAAPDSARAHYAMGDVLVDARQLPLAAEEYRKAVEAAPKTPSTHVGLAGALRLQGKLAEAADELREALRLNPDAVRAHSDLGLVLRAQRNVADSIASYREALKRDPDYIDAHNGLAITFASQAKVEEAVAEFREIVRIDPDSAVGYYNLAIALADIDQDEEAAVALRHVVRINPNHYNARYNLGELFRLEGKFDDSATQFREYLRLAPDTPQNQRNIQRARDFIQSFENK